MTVEYIEELIPLHLRNYYNITSNTKIYSNDNQPTIDYDCCKKCFDESHHTNDCNKDWIKITYPDTLEELIPLYDKVRFKINSKTPIIIDKNKIEQAPIVFIPPPQKKKEEINEFYEIAKKYKLNFPKTKDGFNCWTIMAGIIIEWCRRTDRNYIIFKECVDLECEEAKIEIDCKSDWNTKVEVIKKWAEKEGRDIIISSEPISIDDDRLKLNLFYN